MPDPHASQNHTNAATPDTAVDLYSPELQFNSEFSDRVIVAQHALSERWLGTLGHALPPHISLGGAPDLDAPNFVQEVTASLAQLSRMNLQFTSLGLFPGGVLFTAPVVSRQLLGAHHQLHHVFEKHASGGVVPHYTPDNLVPHTTLATGLRPDQIKDAVRVACEHLELPTQATVDRFTLYDLPATNKHMEYPLAAEELSSGDLAERMLRPAQEMHFLQLHFEPAFNQQVEALWKKLAVTSGNHTLLSMGQPPHLTLAGTESVSIAALAAAMPALADSFSGSAPLRFGSIGIFPQPGGVFLRATVDSSLSRFHERCQEVFATHSSTAPYLYYTEDFFVPNVALLAGQNDVSTVAGSAAESLELLSSALPLSARPTKLALVHSPSGAIKAEVALS